MTIEARTTVSNQIRNLQLVAGFLSAHKDVPPPTHIDVAGPKPRVQWLLFRLDGSREDDNEQKELARRVVRLIGGAADKAAMDRHFQFSGTWRDVEWSVSVDRPAVCERVVTGVEKVTSMVPDPSAPLVEVESEVEQVEWRCEPLLAESEAVAS